MLTDAQRAAYTERLRRGRTAAPAGILRRGAGAGPLPLSFGQEQLWFLDHFAPNQPVYNIPQALRVTGLLDVAALGRALDALVERHEALRTRFVTGPDGLPVQDVAEPSGVVLGRLDLSGLEPDEREKQLEETALREAMAPFDLAEGGLFRTTLIRLDEREWMLILVVHHIVFDAVSFGVFLAELGTLYRAQVCGQPAALPALAVQPADVALWERERAGGAVLSDAADYWRSTLAGFQTLHLPTDRPRPPVEGFEGGVEWLDLGAELWQGVGEVARREQTTPFVVLLTGLLVLLHRYSGQDDVVVGTISANRGRAELAPLIGYLVNALPIRADLSGDPVFRDLLAQVRERTVAAYAHQELPFAKLVEELGVRRDAGRSPVFQVSFNFGEAAPELALDTVTIRPEPIDLPAAKFDLAFFAQVRGDRLWVELSYASALFDRSTVRRMLRNFRVLLAGVVADASSRVSRLPLLTAAERRRELVVWNNTRVDLPSGCVHELFERQVECSPQAVAAEYGGDAVTYAQLNARANRIARWLHAAGVGPEVLVGVCMGPSTRRLAVLMGILKAGGAYVPLDPALPAERLAFMATDAAVAVVVADEAGAAALPPASAEGRLGAEVVSVDAEWEHIAHLDGWNPNLPVEPSNAAYAIYTSGSTGRPKGVLVEHRNLVNHALGIAEQWLVGPADRVLQFASLNFDASVHEIFTALLSGARAVVASSQTRLSPSRLAALIRERQVTFTCLPPAVVNLLTGEQFPDLRVLLVGGEEFPAELVRAWLRPGLRLVNAYGPTEDTVIATSAELDGSVLPPPIGLPVANQQAYVLDPNLNPVPVGVAGELYLGGAGVARGYLNAPELTGQRFIPDPFATAPEARLYKTGDRVRRLPDGNIVFLGRRDGQVKIRGLRIELGEIETGLLAHPDVAQAVVVTADDPAGEKMLVGYVRPRGRAAAADPDGLRRHLAGLLPGYMVPAHVVTIDSFPLNASGKVDRAALPQVFPAQAAAEAWTPDAAPATPTEHALAGIYARLLGLPRVGVEQGFFDLGGNSLQAMRLVAAIQQELGADIAVTAVFLAPTVRRLAARIEETGGGSVRSAARDPLVRLSDGAGEVPLFIVHAVGGTVHPYTPLAACLAGSFQVYGLEAAGLAEGAAPVSSLATTVAEYLNAILAAQPEGPYRLAGWSMGGLVAYEIARRLEGLGKDVARLVLLDAPFAPPKRAESESLLTSRFAADAAQALGWDADCPDDDHLDWLARRVAGGGSAADLAAVRGQIERRFEVYKANTAMVAGFRPAAALRTRTLLISALRSPNAAVQADWTRLLGRNSVLRPVDTDHYSFLRSPRVEEIAHWITESTLETSCNWS
ncbi:amino acid adenylation domain-containing protein [Catenulispora sp. EB89]|uniref:non-ribosomal peptide synthetase n=1 Tax=Catenulispora sp. EB89 TaxID=3156257 RepID=UPI003519BCC3